MTPDSTGEYRPIGAYNGKESYARDDNGWFIWWNGVDAWIISTILGVLGASFWGRTDPNIEGLYTALGGAIGEATVAAL